MKITYQSGANTYYPSYKLITACHNCGHMVMGKIYTAKDPSWETLSSMAKKEIKKCPLCDKKILSIAEYSIYGSSNDSTKELEKALEEQIKEYEAEKSRKDIEEQYKNTIEHEDKPYDGEYAKSIRGDIEKVKEYILHIINMDFSARFLKEQIVMIDNSSRFFTKEKNFKIAMSEWEATQGVETRNITLMAKIEKLEKAFNSKDWESAVLPEKIEAPIKPKAILIPNLVKPTEPALHTPLFFNRKKVEEENARLKTKYEKALAEYEKKAEENKVLAEKNAKAQDEYKKELKEYRKKVKEAKDKALEASMQKKEEARAALNKKIQEIKNQMDDKNIPTADTEIDSENLKQLAKDKKTCLKLLGKVLDTKNKLLSENVLYSNYRDIYAVTSFYEYFNSKRCYEFEGPDGAYNLYEKERRSDSFATFFKTLEDINKNQVVLYRTANEMFEKVNVLETMCKKMLGVHTKENKGKTRPINESPKTACQEFSEKLANYHCEIEDQINVALKYVD